MAKIKQIEPHHLELISGVMLMISFAAAALIANISFLEEGYKNFVFYTVVIGNGESAYKLPLIQIVNDGLMTLFFLLIGLELKFHLVRGNFQDRRLFILPGASAIGGVLVPALIYFWFNMNSPQTLRGWAIPIATDTAFMLGILSFFGRFISTQLRAFILGFSLIDDAIALLILAIFYTKSGDTASVIISIILMGALFSLNRFKIAHSFYYLLIGMFLWISMVKSGVHGTLCGIVLAVAIPVEKGKKINPSFHRLESALKPIVYFLILPLFAFINSGVSIKGFSLEILTTPLALGIILGLFIGKQLGIFLFSYAAIKLKYCALPHSVSWAKFYAIGILGGIGFTLSLFIGDLTFEASHPNYIMRMSVIIGSLLSAIFGTGILVFLKRTH